MIAELLPGDPVQVGRYRLVGRLGSGGMGQVYLGQSPGGRSVAVKVIRADLADRPDFRSRFAREVAAARRVSGIFTAQVVDADSDAEHPWLVTAYVPGPSLAEAVEAQGPMSAPAVIALGAGLAEGLAAIHAAGVVHRDLKPSNVLLAPDGPRIIDFGISRAMDAARLTSTGSIIGSPEYMSPEQAEGRPAGPYSDVFSLGSVLIFAATGKGPFGSGPSAVLLYRIVHLTPDTAGVPAQLRPLVERCLAKDASARPAPELILAELTALPPESGQAPAAPPDRMPASPAPTAPQRGTGGRRFGYAAVAGLLVVAACGFAAVRHFADSASATRPGVHVHSSGSVAPSASPASTQTSPASPGAPASPSAVVRAYLRAISARDYARAWRLGGNNLGESYSTFVAGFTRTRRVVITSLHASGDNVSLHTLAYETSGQVQRYALSYVVQGGVIVAGQATLLGPGPS